MEYKLWTECELMLLNDASTPVFNPFRPRIVTFSNLHGNFEKYRV